MCRKVAFLVISYSFLVFRYKSYACICAEECQLLLIDFFRYDILVKAVQFIDNEYKRICFIS